MQSETTRPTVVDLRHLPRPVAFREAYGYGSPHRPTAAEAVDAVLLGLVLTRRPCSGWPSYLLPEAP